jgi:hypothetical protein
LGRSLVVNLLRASSWSLSESSSLVSSYGSASAASAFYGGSFAARNVPQACHWNGDSPSPKRARYFIMVWDILLGIRTLPLKLVAVRTTVDCLFEAVNGLQLSADTLEALGGKGFAVHEGVEDGVT